MFYYCVTKPQTHSYAFFACVYEMFASKAELVLLQCRATVAEAVGALSALISRAKLSRDLKKIAPNFTHLCKKFTDAEEQYIVVKGIGNFLESTCSDESVPVEQYLDEILNSLFAFVGGATEAGEELKKCLSPNVFIVFLADAANVWSMKLRNQALRCFNVAARRFADKIVYYLLHKLQSEKEIIKSGATKIIRHLLNSSGKYAESFVCLLGKRRIRDF